MSLIEMHFLRTPKAYHRTANKQSLRNRPFVCRPTMHSLALKGRIISTCRFLEKLSLFVVLAFLLCIEYLSGSALRKYLRWTKIKFIKNRNSNIGAMILLTAVFGGLLAGLAGRSGSIRMKQTTRNGCRVGPAADKRKTRRENWKTCVANVIKPGHLYKQLGGQRLRHQFSTMHFHCNRSLGQIYYLQLCVYPCTRGMNRTLVSCCSCCFACHFHGLPVFDAFMSPLLAPNITFSAITSFTAFI